MMARLCERRKDAAGYRRHLKEGFAIGSARGITYYAPLTPSQLAGLAETAVSAGICADHCSGLLAGIKGTPQHRLRIFCLGGFRVERCGVLLQEREWKSKRAKTLFKLLAAGCARVSRDTVIDALWPDGSAKDRTSIFSSLLHRARRAVDTPERSARSGSCISQEGEAFFLNTALVWTDVAAFLDAIGKARRSRSAGTQQEALAAYEQAIEQYAGDLLPGDLYEPWTAGHREELRRLFTEAMDHAAEAREVQGDRERSQVLYERMFTVDPCHDKACRWLMQVHAAEGERNKAVRIYERHELAVRQDLDMEPDERTKKVYRSIIGD
jgi:DNA-binding SARP family transcriptional activator